MVRGKIKKMMAAALAATMVFTMTACGSDSEEKTADGYAKEIYLYNWSEYMSEDVLNKFEEEYGINVVETTFESNDEMLAKHLAVMDLTATSLAMENDIPVVVFALADPQNIVRAVMGEPVGTVVTK